MSTPEQNMWKSFSSGIKNREFDFWRVENQAAGDGMPDVIAINVHGVSFWLENKVITDFPKRESTCVFGNRTFRPGQLPFLRQWRGRGGRSFVNVKIGNEFFLLNPDDNLMMFTKRDVFEFALSVGKSNIIEFLRDLK